MTLSDQDETVGATLRLPDGRQLALALFGDPSGAPVLALHGTPGSRLMMRALGPAARAAGLRLIAPDRPGYGRSTPHLGRTLATFAADLEHLADAHRLDRVGLLGISGGAPYAVAAAARLGPRVAALALVSPMGPVTALDPLRSAGLSLTHRWLFLRLSQHPSLLRPMLTTALIAFRRAPLPWVRWFGAFIGGPDRIVLGRAPITAHVAADVAEATRQGIEAVVEDVQLFGRPWGVDPASVAAPALIWHGGRDPVVPAAAVERLAESLPRARLERLAGAGHFWIYEEPRRALDALSAAMAG